MERRPPSILSAASSASGGIEVTWDVDTFFSDSEAPEKVVINLNGVLFSGLDGDQKSVEIPLARLAELGTATVTISISFWWSEPLAEEKQSTVTMLNPAGGGGGNAGVLPAAQPIVKLVAVNGGTLQAPSSITIKWESNNYNDGNIIWGPEDHPESFRHNIKPHGEIYSGKFQTDQALPPVVNYVFKVEVRNTLHSPDWISTTFVVRSAGTIPSLREFLLASSLPISSSIHALVDSDRSVRRMILGRSASGRAELNLRG